VFKVIILVFDPVLLETEPAILHPLKSIAKDAADDLKSKVANGSVNAAAVATVPPFFQLVNVVTSPTLPVEAWYVPCANVLLAIKQRHSIIHEIQNWVSCIVLKRITRSEGVNILFSIFILIDIKD
jgi:hypothetical protein